MAAVGQCAVFESSCAVQQRLLHAISRLAALGGRDLESADISRLEAVITELEHPRKGLLEFYGTDLGMPFDVYDTSSEVSWASDDPALQSMLDNAMNRYPELSQVPVPLTSNCSVLQTAKENAPPIAWSSDCCPLPEPLKPWEVEPEPLPTTAEVDVWVPESHVMGGHVTIEYAGLFYQVEIPVEYTPGSVFRVPLLVSQPVSPLSTQNAEVWPQPTPKFGVEGGFCF